MTTPVIQAKGLSKRYVRGSRSSTGLLRDTLARTLRSPWTVFQRRTPATFWALHDVSLPVGGGEGLGLVCRDRSGKTTLLKTPSRVARHTSRLAELHGPGGTHL